MRWLQYALLTIYRKVERWLSHGVGVKLNPVHHLGSMSFYLFWVVGASGLYLYAFFETGVEEAYSSVEALTHAQWWAGGIMRSVHRYASDAMVVTMVLHLLRHFAFGRFHGERWFSWVTGVVLAWLVFVCGINGYMLPWDKLAQFTLTVTFEWLDWLPMFGGTLMRNFVHAGSVSDRFFSLLSFLHVGLPLLVLLLMWVHVHRLPLARTSPPWPVAAMLTGALVLLSLIKPALSQGSPADFATAVTTVGIDWFYLAFLPLAAVLPPAQTWALSGAATAWLVALPWWPTGGRPAPHRV
ncbi:cytochrome b N-terminal domain-containing protein [Ramlibacter albus]|uniref:Cytochrome b N-terminal domain-containing protein n=1 Tax=Ramlibacter albus TaxID=2079448 RepID=A0A923MFL5_9BURK|nr:cytochrome b N-terminal domain-containing protein [Ramlibacter albus]MBC5768701.1 cytochrome b N-terminal domain-containing protein [Ramlibacter albus]